MPRRAETSLLIAAPPAEVAARLKAATRFRLVPAEARFIGRHDRPLAGIVPADGFRVGLNRRDPLTRLQAVAVGTVRAEGGGSRVDVVAGLPGWLTWLLRLGFVGGALATIGGMAAVAAQGDVATAALTLAALGVFLLATSLGLGLNVANADAQLPELLAQVETVLRAEAPRPIEVQPEAQPAAQPDVQPDVQPDAPATSTVARVPPRQPQG